MKASQVVGISQPTLSQQIKKLEAELGETLFERSPQSVTLTEAGAKFLPYAKAAIENLKQGEEALKKDQNQISGTIKIAFIPTIGPYLLPKVIKSLKESAPQLNLKLYEETTSVLIENLKRGIFDVGLLALPIDEVGIASKQLATEEFLFAVPANSKIANKKTVTIKEVTKEPILMLKEGHCFRDQALDFCNMTSSDTNLIFEGSSLVSVLNLVSSGEGVTLVPKMAVSSRSYPNIKFIPFTNPKPFRDIGVVWRMTTPLSRSQKFLIDQIGSTFKN